MPRAKRKAVANTEIKAKKARGETDLGHGLHWKYLEVDSAGACPLIALVSETLPGTTKVAGFDVDCTIIKTASGRTFAIGSNDWVLWDEKKVPEKLKKLNDDGFRIIFFTNQAGIEKGKVTPQSFKDKMEAIIKELGIPILVFAATGTNNFRKPSTTMWDYFEQHFNRGVKVDKSKSVYIGDAAGRAKNWARDKPKDFSCGDRMFAANVGVKFATPEEFFLDEAPAPFEWHSVDPNGILAKTPAITKANDKSLYASKNQEIVIMVGPPASGKSTFRQRYFEPHGYVVVNRDTLGTAEKCIKGAKEAVKQGKSVVVDNTNPSASARASYIQIAKDKGIPCRCFWLQTSLELAHHLNLVRQNQTNGKIRRIPDVGYNVFKKQFEDPSVSEGFTSVVKVDFQPRFDSKRDEELFKQWTG